MKKIRVGIIGCGKIAQIRHIPEFQLQEHVQVIAICDMNIERAQHVAQQYQIPNVFKDFRELIDQTEIDAVSICTPNTTHADIAVYALKKGKHVLVEKPMATSYLDGLRMVEAAEENKVVLMVGHNQRFHPLHKRVKEWISSHRIGIIHQFSTNYHHGGPEYWSVDGKKSWFFRREEAGYGVISDLGIHKLDLIQWLLDEKIEEINALHNTFQKEGNVEDSAVLVTRLESGAIGTINLSWNNPLQDHRTVLYGERGVLIFGETLCGIQIQYNDGKQVEEEVVLPLRPDGLMNSGMIEHFISCVRTGEKPSIAARDVLNSMKLLLEAVNL